MAKIYDRFMSRSEEACLAAWRGELLAPLSGEVLEVGAGTGANLAHYPPLERLVLTEPDSHMRRQLEARAQRLAFPTECRGDEAEALGFDDESFDAVVVTLVLCSVTHVGRTLHELKRVLRPGGRLVFLEHVGAEHGTSRRRWQGRVEPVWKRVAGNCHLTRDTERALVDAGFELDQVTRESMRKALPLVRPTVRGIARRPCPVA